MKRFEIILRGDDTCEWRHIIHRVEDTAESYDEIKAKYREWCDDNFVMGGYEWSIESIKEIPNK